MTKKYQRIKQLLKRICDGTLKRIVFTDKKLFAVEETFNHQIDRLIVFFQKSSFRSWHFRKMPQNQETDLSYGLGSNLKKKEGLQLFSCRKR